MFVLSIPAVGILVSVVTSAFITEGEEVDMPEKVNSSLKNQLIISTALLLPGLYIITSLGFGNFKMVHNDGKVTNNNAFDIFSCISFGLVAGLIIGYVTEVMTSYSYKPVK